MLVFMLLDVFLVSECYEAELGRVERDLLWIAMLWRPSRFC